MATYANPLIRIDLGKTEIQPPCAQHERAGWQGDCDDCKATDPKEVPVPELEGFWVEIRNPKLLPFGEKRRLFAPAPPVVAEDNAEQAQRKAEMAEERLVRIVKGLITAWNLTAVDDPDGAVLPIPREDAEAFDRAPDIVLAVFEAVGRYNREQALPKARATS